MVGNSNRGSEFPARKNHRLSANSAQSLGLPGYPQAIDRIYRKFSLHRKTPTILSRFLHRFLLYYYCNALDAAKIQENQSCILVA